MTSDKTVVGIALKGNPESVIYRRGDGPLQVTPAPTGTIWLCPKGVAEDSIRVTGDIPDMLHLYLPARPFEALSSEEGYPDVDATCVNYVAGVNDPLLVQLGFAIAEELQAETAGGKLLVETATLLLAARLLQKHATTPPRGAGGRRRARPLDATRLRRVTEFVDAHLDLEIGVDDLAAVACLSPFHFSRAFKAATGLPPHRFVGARRLQRAKTLLARADVPLAQVALASCFSSQASFTKAFRRAVGVAPGAWRRGQR